MKYPCISLGFQGLARGGATLLLAAFVASGCGNLTAGGFGEARVAVSGDAPDPVAASAPTLGASVIDGPARSDHEEDDEVDPEGALDLEFRLFLGRADGTEVDLTDGNDVEAELDLEGDVEVDAVEAIIPAGRYLSFRIAFSEIEVDVSAGVVIDGDTIQGPIEIELEGPGLEVVRLIDLEVRDGSVVEFLLDLNAANWLRFIDPVTKSVTAEDFAEAFSLVVR
ncbi:MAG: hypothetical protein WD995_10985 [Gemmatimonadota bacterium]